MSALVILLVSPALAHDEHAENDAWYRSLQSRSGVSCCDESEAIKIEEPGWRQVESDTDEPAYQVWLEGEWVNVPAIAVVKQVNRVGFAIVWPYPDGSGKLAVRCFLPGTGV